MYAKCSFDFSIGMNVDALTDDASDFETRWTFWGRSAEGMKSTVQIMHSLSLTTRGGIVALTTWNGASPAGGDSEGCRDGL